nr:EOG090X015P [Triops cancriformis]
MDSEVRNRKHKPVTSSSQKKAKKVAADPHEENLIKDHENETEVSGKQEIHDDSETFKKAFYSMIPPQPQTITLHFKFDLLVLSLFALALVTRFYHLEEPRHIVFDELHYGRYAGLYAKNTFFFDSHPPLGKQLVALAAHLAGFDGNFKFDRIGSPYNASVPVFALRVVPALCGSLLIPTAYQIMLELGYPQWTAALAGFLFLFDNALLTQSHYALMESILLLFSLSGILFVLKFRQEQARNPFSSAWWTWLALSAASLTCAMCVKYVGFYSLCLGLAMIAHDFWNSVLSDHKLSKMEVVKQAFARVITYIVVPVAIYISVFYVHLSILTRAGPHDSAMSSAFQASLEGGLSSIVRGQPLEIVHGSQVTLRHSEGKPCWLHSHPDKYPIKYADKRGSSHQQQVTCYGHKDTNNWWIVKRPDRSDLVVAAPLDKIQDGDMVQIVHGITGRNLNSHNVAAPMSPTKQEVSCYMDHNVSMPAQDLWRLEIINKKDVGTVWHAVESMIRLIHVNTSQALAFTGRILPEWGYSQHEIATDPMINHQDTVWNVEEHKYTRNENQEDRSRELHNNDFIPLEPTKLTFWQKFLELQFRMLLISNENVQNHMYTSSPWEWLTLTRGIAYWVSPDSNAQIHLLGNVAIWYSASLGIAGFVALFVLYLLRQRRQCYDLPPSAWRQYVAAAEVLFAGYVFHFAPYFFVDHTLFLHHYLPALAFQLLLMAAFVHHVVNVIRSKVLSSLVSVGLIAWALLVVYVFQRYLPLCYGTGPQDAAAIMSLKLKDSWDFIIHRT